MILTDKAKKDFGLWHFENGNSFEYINFHNLSDNLRNAIIIEFFDSVKLWEDVFYKEYRATGFKDYKKAITEAIKKANEIFNETI